ncbi:MAG: GAF and ANTAR domain-containing protein [Streptosporangiales bacterium]
MTDIESSSEAQRESRLVQAFVDMADTLVDDYDVADLLHQLAEHCVELLDAAAAGLMLADQRGSLQVLAYSTERTRLLELFQLQADEGPCLDCYRTGEPILVGDLSTTTARWPSFAPEAMREEFASVHAVPLRLRSEVIGALNLFGRETGSMTEQDLRVARALADTATIGILQERTIHRGDLLTEQLQSALNNRVMIEQAKGVLAHAGALEMDQAFEELRSYRRRHSARLSDIAHQLATGALHPSEVLTPRAGQPAPVIDKGS